MIFLFSKIFWLIFNPFSLLTLIILSGLIFKIFKLSKAAIICFFLAFLFFFMIAILPIGSFLIYNLEKNFSSKQHLPNNIDGILILAGATNPYLSEQHNEINLNDSAERLIESIFLINKFPQAKIVFSGGSGSIQNINLDHSAIAKRFFSKMGMSNKINYENKSRNTFESLLFSKNMIKPNIDERWILVTSAYHLKRSLLIAEEIGWNFIPYPTDFQVSKKFAWKFTLNFLSNINKFQKGSHEWVGIISYIVLKRFYHF